MTECAATLKRLFGIKVNLIDTLITSELILEQLRLLCLLTNYLTLVYRSFRSHFKKDDIMIICFAHHYC